MLSRKFRFNFIHSVLLFSAATVVNACEELENSAQASETGNVPFIVAIAFEKFQNTTSNTISYNYGCAGVLIAKKFVLTAAHCFERSNPVAVLLGLPETYDAKGNSNSVIVDAKNVVIHPQYRSFQTGPIHSDIAVVELENEVNYTKNIHPICLTTATDIPTEDTVLYGSGIRRDENRKVQTDILLTGTAKIEPNSNCNEMPGLDETNLCVLDSEELCETISGSALVSVTTDPNTGKRKQRLIGIKVAGAPCRHSKLKIYTKVSAHLEFIKNIILKNKK